MTITGQFLQFNLGQFIEHASLEAHSFVMRAYRTFDRDSCSIPWGLATYCSELRHYIVDKGN